MSITGNLKRHIFNISFNWFLS